MKIAVLGTRGIPNSYGGFEQFAEYLSQYLVANGHEVSVYNSSTHPFKGTVWRKVNIITKSDPERQLGSFSQFIYDLNCILDSRNRGFDIILQLGYTSSSIWGWLIPSDTALITNMDGLEWKRSKYSRVVRKFLKIAEKLAVNSSDHLISDSKAIQDYLFLKYRKKSTYIPYGADIFKNPISTVLGRFEVVPYSYSMLIARLEPENNIEVILKGITFSKSGNKFLVIGNHHTKYGNFLKTKYNDERIKFLGSIYDLDILNNLRYYCKLYFHGHSVGGTNPSLLEAMASSALICANDNPFNKSILEDDAFYFKDEVDVCRITDAIEKANYLKKIENNLQKIKNEYSWLAINKSYENFLMEALLKGNEGSK